MRLVCIASAVNSSKKCMGYRLFDIDSGETRDVSYEELLYVLKNKKCTVENLQYSDYDITWVCGSMQRYPMLSIINNKVVPVLNTNTKVLIQMSNDSYSMINLEGNSVKVSREDIKEYASKDEFANARIVNNLIQYIGRKITGKREIEMRLDTAGKVLTIKAEPEDFNGNELKIPDRVNTRTCYHLTNIVFNNEKTGRMITRLILPNTIGRLCKQLFEQMPNLEYLECMSDGGNHIRTTVYTFKNTPFINHIKLKHMDMIGSFKGMKNLKKLEVENKSREIGDYRFHGCNKLENINEIISCAVYINDGAFYGCDQLKHVILPECLARIESRAFEKCINIESVTFKNDLTHLVNSTKTSFDIKKALNTVIEPTINEVEKMGEELRAAMNTYRKECQDKVNSKRFLADALSAKIITSKRNILDKEIIASHVKIEYTNEETSGIENKIKKTVLKGNIAGLSLPENGIAEGKSGLDVLRITSEEVWREAINKEIKQILDTKCMKNGRDSIYLGDFIIRFRMYSNSLSFRRDILKVHVTNNIAAFVMNKNKVVFFLINKEKIIELHERNIQVWGSLGLCIPTYFIQYASKCVKIEDTKNELLLHFKDVGIERIGYEIFK